MFRDDKHRGGQYKYRTLSGSLSRLTRQPPKKCKASLNLSPPFARAHYEIGIGNLRKDDALHVEPVSHFITQPSRYL